MENTMQTVMGFIEEMGDKVSSIVENMDKVSADNVGLDRRCGKLWIDADCVVTREATDRQLQYYGGFEYIDPEYRQTFGGWVVYTEHERVTSVIEAWERLQDEDEE
jgi:hypothetical protein